MALCAFAGEAHARCGDGTLESAERCDDANTRSGDGCSATCTVETGFTCAMQTAIPLDNGDFERPSVQRFNAVDNYVPGWTIAPSTQIDYIALSTEWTCADGSSGCIDLAGTPSRGVIYRDIPTSPGAAHTVFFRMAANCSAPCTKQGYVSVANGDGAVYASALYVATVPINNTLRTDYEFARFSFTARSSSSRLIFSGTELSLAGMFIDDVSIPASVCASMLCGNGQLNAGEACDDGNTRDSDGCSSACQVESSYLCPTPGARCRSTCGDAVVVGTEPCDDGNTEAGDGCSATCAVESGYVCGVANALDPRSVCRRRPVLIAPADGSVVTDRRPVIRGTATPGATITVVVDGAEVGTATADARGDWSVTPMRDLADGRHSVSAGERFGLFVAGSATHDFIVGISMVDAGADAALTDAGAIDAAAADAGLSDVSAADARGIDAVIADAALADAALADAALADAALADVTTIDSLSPDAWSTDALEVDAGASDPSRGDAVSGRVDVIEDAPRADDASADAASDDGVVRDVGAPREAATADGGTPDMPRGGCGCRASGAAQHVHGLALTVLVALRTRRRRRAVH
jgi:cysteine-rich repeat protein